jgi:hypothetical protein
MTKLIYILLLLVFYCKSFGQTKIDEIKKDREAIRFVFDYGKKNNMEWKKVSLDDLYGSFSRRSMDKDDKAFLDSLTKNKWIKLDFNNDGVTDLIFFGRLYKRQYNQLGVLSFISDGDSIVCKHLGNLLSNYYPSGISSFKQDGLNFLTISSYVGDNTADSIRGLFKTDTLIYKFGGFVEFDWKNEKQIQFDSVVYNTSGLWMGLIEVPELKIYKNGYVSLYRNKLTNKNGSMNWKNELYECIISKEAIVDMNAILNYINFEGLNSNYFIRGVLDLDTQTTQIFYQGKSKKIEDYGGHGTYGLSLLYNKINEIKFKCLTKKAE